MVTHAPCLRQPGAGQPRHRHPVPLAMGRGHPDPKKEKGAGSPRVLKSEAQRYKETFLVQKIISSSKGQESCSQIPVLIPLPSCSKGSREPCTDFPWRRHLCQNCSHFSPVCSVLVPSCQTSHPLLLQSSSAQAVPWRARGCRRLCAALLFHEEGAELSRTCYARNVHSVQRPLLPTKDPQTLRSSSCACKAIT